MFDPFDGRFPGLFRPDRRRKKPKKKAVRCRLCGSYQVQWVELSDRFALYERNLRGELVLHNCKLKHRF